MPRAIVITGASRGLGRALAVEYAAPGVALALIGRDAAALGAVARLAEAKGARVRIGRIDVRDRDALSAFLVETDEADATDCLIASAGVTMVTPRAGAVEDLTRAQDLFDVNLNGMMNTLAPLAPRMRARRQGQIALFGSIAAFAPPPDSPSYAASKAAIVAFALATRALYHADGVSVSVVCPGFVDTDMTGSFDSAKPFLLSAEDAARRIRRGLARRRAVIAFPRRLYYAARFQQLLPEPLRRRILLAFRATARP
ncbi:short-subunit dehydrogenase [Roseiarcus fermentans]|uniref:Short-subunit dehydrogenase n=1 Tax=Roseiarcus fermentans TaxID=1473586 RepID=A0A366FSZ0_9HYPH|nr:SDR family NAD(P)-dependent oxidoreductase [Roseiarcus fermentans]RBP17160.1 short-subunit dehydrogenase [Roseiarcus fermentans]